ncbi:MAG: hypothetical protein V3U96_09800 [Paracoccaceae bacterium]
MRHILAIGLALTTSACSGGGSAGSASSLNPFNWFNGAAQQGQSTARTLAPSRGYGIAVDTRPLLDQITSLKIEKTATGAIVRATGLAPAQGYHSADLVLSGPTQSGQVTFQFRARPPSQQTAVGPAHLREIVAAYFLSHAQLAGIRRINVAAQRNSVTARN